MVRLRLLYDTKYLHKMISTTTYSKSTGIRLVVFNFSGSMLNLFSNSHAL